MRYSFNLNPLFILAFHLRPSRIHQCISINMLAQKLNMSEDEAEKWVVNMIRNARLDAKIDSEKGHVVMGTLGTSPYQQVGSAVV